MRKSTSLDKIEVIPQNPGVYLFFSKQGHLLYIGKSITLRTRIRSHIAAAKCSSKEERLMRQVAHIEWEETVGELGALLREATLIKQHQPLYNRRLRKSRILYGLRFNISKGSYNCLELLRLDSLQSDQIHTIYGLARTRRQLFQKIREYAKTWNLCAKLTLLEKGAGPCFYFQIRRCKGACINLEKPLEYNGRLLQAFSQLRIESWPFESSIIIKEKSRTSSAVDYHKIDKWCHVASERNKKFLNNKRIACDNSFDFDIYKIIAKCLLTPSPTLEIMK